LFGEPASFVHDGELVDEWEKKVRLVIGKKEEDIGCMLRSSEREPSQP
jgi:hypothetical protein